MTREDCYDWMRVHGCHPEPIEGVNVTGNTVKVINPANNRYTYFKTPINDFEMPDNLVRQACINLVIPFPDCVAVKE